MSDAAETRPLNQDRVYYLKTSNNNAIWYTHIKGIMDPVKTLIDSGSSRNFINISYARRHSLPLIELQHQRSVIGIDGQEVEGKIRFRTTIEITIEGRTFKQRFYAMPLGDTEAILGMTWLKEANPEISWEDLSIRYRDETIQGKATQEQQIPKEFQDYSNVFSEELFKGIPPHRGEFDCAINLREGMEAPKAAKPFAMTATLAKEVTEYLDGEMTSGKIQPSESKTAAACFYVPKKDGTRRLVIDYRNINEVTVNDKFPIPLQEDLLEKVREAKIFSKLDLRMGYNNIRIKEGDEWKTAFRTKEGLYEYRVMPFGLKNAPAVFQRFMNHIFRDMIDVYVVIYLDDILIYSKNREEHTKHVQSVLKRLMENHLFLKLKKCEFYTTTVTYVGIVITPEGVSMEKDKIEAIQEWKTPKTVKHIQAFLGFANFYRRFVNNFSKIVKPLTALTQKEKKWQWGSEEQEAFQTLKNEITKDPVLVHPNRDKPYFLETDASGVAMGAILSQKGSDGYLHPIAFLSKSFNKAQMNYDTHDKELLAIITSLLHWRLFLELTEEPITVYTDHRNLEYWKTAREFKRRHSRWYGEIASFNFHIVYRAGKLSNKPDALSRRHDHLDLPKEHQTMIAAERYIGFRAEDGIDIISAIQEAQEEDESMEVLLTSVKGKDKLPPSIRKQYERYEWKENLLWYDGKILVPDSSEIRLKLLEHHHDEPIAGHQGHARTLELLSRRYYWAGMKVMVNRFVDSCEICQRAKGHKGSVPLKNMGIPNKPWEEINYDFIVKLPLSNGFDSILVVVDRFSRQAHFIPCLESTNAEELAEIFVRDIWKHHGLPKKTISDRGSTFNSHFLKALYQKLNIDPAFSTAYHPETDGLAERTNQWLEGFLRSFCNYQQDDWAKWLPIAEFCHNNQTNSATGKTAFEAVYGHNPRWDMTGVETNVPEANQMEEHMKEVWDEVKASMEYHQKAEKEQKDEYHVGQKVWLVTSNIKTKRPMRKLDSKKIGPFLILEKVSSHAYRLDLPRTMKIHNVFHANLLTPFKEDSDFHRRQVAPPPVVTEEGEEEFEVEKIITWERRKKGLYYQVRWKGYGPEEDTMERAEKIAELDEVMAQYLADNPSAPVPKGYKRPSPSSIKEQGKEGRIDISSSPTTSTTQQPQQPQTTNSKPWATVATTPTLTPSPSDEQTICLPWPSSPLPPSSPPLQALPRPSTWRPKSEESKSRLPRTGTSSSPTSWPNKSTPPPSSNISRYGSGEPASGDQKPAWTGGGTQRGTSGTQ